MLKEGFVDIKVVIPVFFSLLFSLSAHAEDFYWVNTWGAKYGKFSTPQRACDDALDNYNWREIELVEYPDGRGIKEIIDRSLTYYAKDYNPYYACNGTFIYLDPSRYPWKTMGISYATRYGTQCPDGSVLDETTGICVTKTTYQLAPEFALPCPSSCDRSSPNTVEGNPIDAATGIKFESATDIAIPGDSLSFRRVYRLSGNANASGQLGIGWSHSLARQVDADVVSVLESTSVPKSSGYRTPEAACTEGWLELQDAAYRGLASTATPVFSNGLCTLTQNGQTVARARVYSSEGALAMPTVRSISRPDGSMVTFEEVSGQWQPVYGGDWQLNETSDGWHLTDGQGHVEHYDAQGRIVSTTNRRGETTTYTHNADGQLVSVTSPRGRSLSLTYDAQGRIASVTGPGGSVNYAYDTDNRLSTITYPDGTARQYVYEDTRFPWALTGMIDEKGVRYATWAYDTEGRAILSEHANGAERTELTYNADGTTTATGADGGRRIYHFEVIQGSLRPIRITHE